MNDKPRPQYLTKSRFKLGLECPTKLFYTNKREYANNQNENSFLKALAAGGYQVGELAKLYYPEGSDVTTLDSAVAIEQTQALLESDHATVFEAAICFEDLLIRVDILQKQGNHFNLIEVKAKSIDPTNPDLMKNNDNGPTSGWNPYLQDVSFQHHVLKKTYPGCSINCYLMLVDKTVTSPLDGLHTRFRIVRDARNRQSVVVDPHFSPDEFEPRLLTLINVDEAVQWIRNNQRFNDRSFQEHIKHLSHIYHNDVREQGPLGKHCLSCEFKVSGKNTSPGLSSGYHECWQQELKWTDVDFEKSTVLNIWDLKSANKLMGDGKLHLDTLTTEDVKLEEDDRPGMSRSQRQWKQINKARDADTTPYIDRDGLAAKFDSWQYPLHFIDFETTSPALPFTRGMKPYETIAFQFSHHVMHRDGRVEHKGQFLETTPGTFPNLDFVRELKQQLSHDQGTVFRFHNHENTVLVSILEQLARQDMANTEETTELTEFIMELTHSPAKATSPWLGSRNMVDLYQLNLRYYYHPATRGVNSLKALLPALVSSSQYLQEKYGAPVYGASDGIPSLNFTNHQWITETNDVINDPYSLLPPLQNNLDKANDALLSDADRIADGGAAMTAYGHLQYVEMGDAERQALNSALLKYCELDTLAMVMVVEGWRELLE